MNVTAGFAAAAIFAGTAVGVASPARADDFTGTYIPNRPGLHSTWVVSSCGRDCAHVADSTGWGVDAHPVDGLWRFVVGLPDGTKCNNDGTAPGTVTFTVDAPRQQGTFLNATTNPAPCLLAPGYSHPVYFSLTRV
jgi:hypothetical protein